MPLVPVKVTTKFPRLPVHDRVELPEPPVTLPGVRVQLRPLLGVITADNVTASVKPFSGNIVIVEFAMVPTFAVITAGFAMIVNSGDGVAT